MNTPNQSAFLPKGDQYPLKKNPQKIKGLVMKNNQKITARGKTVVNRISKTTPKVFSTAPAVTKCNNCDVFTNYTRKLIGSIIIIMTHLNLQSESRVIKTFAKLPHLLNSASQSNMTAHWMTVISQDLGFLESYGGKMAKMRSKMSSERLRMKQLDQTYKFKMRLVQKVTKGFQDALEKIAPVFITGLKIQDKIKNMMLKILKQKVEKLKRNVKHYEELMRQEYVPKMKSMEVKLKTVSSICQKTERALSTMEDQLDVVNEISKEHKNKYEVQLSHNKNMITQFDNVVRKNEFLQYEIKNLTMRDQSYTQNIETLEKSLAELKEQNVTLIDTIKQLTFQLKATIQMNYKVTKELEEEKKAKESLIKVNDETKEIGRMKMLALQEMNAQLKEKLQFSTNMKRDFSARFDCDLSDADDVKTDPSENDLSFHVDNRLLSSCNSDISHMTGNPCADIKAQIVANYKLIKQLEKEILSLNKLRVKIKAAHKDETKKSGRITGSSS